jgi:hypothetical protein
MASFETLLIEEFIELGQPENCRVYRRGGADDGYGYFFSPVAGTVFDTMLRLWNGVGVSEPTNLHLMQVII